jgi:YggT family protein
MIPSALSECGHLGRATPGVKDTGGSRLVPPQTTRYGAPHPCFRGGIPMRALLEVILIALEIYVWLLIASAVLSWLIAFNVVNTRNQFVSMLWDFLTRITEPALAPIRAILPNLGGIDISPVVLILIIILIEKVIVTYVYPNVF